MSNDTDTEIGYWLNEIECAKKRDKEYREAGQRVIDIYACDDVSKVPFNILYSNTDTLLPALYSATPRPAVKQRFKEQTEPLISAAAQAGNKMLQYLIDTGTDGYETFDEGMRNATLDALLPGRGVTRIKYDAEIGIVNNYETKQSELVCIDSILWDRILFGYSKKWSTLPWLAFEEHISKDEAVRLFGKEMAGKLQYLKNDDTTDDEHWEKEGKTDEHQGGQKTACIYQIWDKTARKVRYLSGQYKDDFLKQEDDPLELSGFFPIPRPIMFVEKSHDLQPIAPYLVYENQAKELNNLSTRIIKLSNAIKAKGIYDAELGSDVEELMKGADNEFIPADKSSALAAEKGFQNAIWFLPINEMVQVLVQLIQSREQCKQVIYEVTGISDIIRGATDASETFGAQELKSQWGTMRLKRLQGEVQRYARDVLRIMLEIAATKFSEQTWAKMTGLQFVSSMQLQQAQLMPNHPESQQLLQQISWDAVLGVLKNDQQRSFSIDIETNSTIAPEAAEDQKNIAEVMTSLGQYLQGVTPLVQSGSFPFEGAKALMMAIVRRFQFGDEIEDYIKQMQPPQPQEQPQDNTLQVKQMDMQAKQEELQATNMIEQGKAATEMRLKQMEIDSAERIKQAEIESNEKVSLAIANIQRETQLELERMRIDSSERQSANQMQCDMMGSENADVSL